MVKKILSVVVAFLMLFCTIPLSVFADDVLSVCPKCGERTYVQKTGLTVDACGIGVTYNSKHCNSCRYSYYDWVLFGVAGYKEFDSGSGDSLPADFISEWIVKNFGKDVKFSQFQAGGGSASPGGVGRNPSGYSREGTPNIDLDGYYIISLKHDYSVLELTEAAKFNSNVNDSDLIPTKLPSYLYCSHSSATSDLKIGKLNCSEGVSTCSISFPYLYKFDGSFETFYTGVAPFDGEYKVYIKPVNKIDGEFNYMVQGVMHTMVSHETEDAYTKTIKGYYLKGEKISCVAIAGIQRDYKDRPYYSSCLSPSTATYCQVGVPYLMVKPVVPTYTVNNNITINNNTWNGNIYTDNSTNLTYIYPQYTTVNENNETVTNISNNPIIYNEETKQYYTYDSVTNNYYYITYGDPAPTPTPSPSPDPGGSTPDPGKPTPTPTPGGSDSSGGGSGFNPFKWLADLLKDIVEGIFKAVWKLITSIFGFLIWLVSLLGNVLPFLPSEGLAALSAAAIIITVIRIIKFILGR